MDVELKLEPGRTEPKVVILAGEPTPVLERLVRELSGLALTPIPVWRGEEMSWSSGWTQPALSASPTGRSSIWTGSPLWICPSPGPSE